MRELAGWSESVSVGNLDIDRQHKNLFRLGQVALNLLGDEAIVSKRADEVLNDIVEAMRQCFASEEKLLARNSCPFLKQHAAEHMVFNEQLTRIIYQSARDADELHKVLRDWTSRHVPEIDELCRDCGVDIFRSPINTVRVCKRAIGRSV